jgi:peptidoglycan/xylan/chitin deacetylase (PgdA/CDA1 family)
LAGVGIAAAILVAAFMLVNGNAKNGGDKPSGSSGSILSLLHSALPQPFPIYHVNFDVSGTEGAAVDPPSYKVGYGTPPGRLPVARKEGMRFTGWYTGNEGDASAVLVNNATLAQIPADRDSVLYARFEQKPASVDKGSMPLAVLMYHYFYVPEDGEGSPNGNYLNIHTFEKQVSWLVENGYYFPEWEEVIDYIYGDALLPDKSIVLTSDDAYESFFRLGIPIADKYGINLTSFVIGIDHTPEDFAPYKDNPNLSFQSHSYALHRRDPQPDGVILQTSTQAIIEDIAKSVEVSGSKDAFAYPFGHFNDHAEEALKEAGVKLAFTTVNGKCYPMMDPYALPRIRIDERNSWDEFVNKVSL